ncbi:MAG: ParB/RepB/Spo0J family partition protein [Candidatus Nitrotoga sp.]
MVKLNKGLGRGLDALLSGSGADSNDVLREIEIVQLQPGKYQPRSSMDEVSLNNLADSIKTQGIMQPILVREINGNKFEIIAGERRWRAAQIAGLRLVPVIVRNVENHAALAMALIENIQRENLNPLEEAIGIQRLIGEFQLTHQAASEVVGRSRSATSNLLRLLNLSQHVQEMLMRDQIEMGHARALLALTGAQQVAVANKVIAKKLSVRETEKLVHEILNPAIKKVERKKIVAGNTDILRLQEKMADQLGAKVGIQHKARGVGKLIIEYKSLEQLDGLLQKMGIVGNG